MEASIKKAVNRAKDSLTEQEGPARKDQSTAPIADGIRNYWARDTLTFAIPAHNGGRGPLPEFTQWAGIEVARADVPVTHGIDTRDSAFGLVSTAQELFAEAAGAKQVLFSTGGSSLSVRVAIMSVVGPGDTIVMARNGHKSAFAGLVMSGARPVYVDPYYDEELEIAHGVLADEFAAALDAHPEAKAAMVFSPSYYGTSTDIKALADLCHARRIPLVTDDAWGLDYAFGSHAQLPDPALAQGADLAIGSVHKTLTGLSQTSVLSVGSDLIDSSRLQLCFELEESTSSSSLLLSSIDGARCQFVREGKELLDRGVETALRLRSRIAEEVPELQVIEPERLAAVPGVTGVDPMHVLIETRSVGLSGFEANDWLRYERDIEVELSDHRRVMPLVSFAHSPENVERFVRALRDLVDAHPGANGSGIPRMPSRPQIRSEAPMLPRDAFFGATEAVDADQAPGRISAEWVTPYPPGIPAVAPGELYNEDNVAYLKAVMEAGGYVEGASDPSLQKLRVVAR